MKWALFQHVIHFIYKLGRERERESEKCAELMGALFEFVFGHWLTNESAICNTKLSDGCLMEQMNLISQLTFSDSFASIYTLQMDATDCKTCRSTSLNIFAKTFNGLFNLFYSLYAQLIKAWKSIQSKNALKTHCRYTLQS